MKRILPVFECMACEYCIQLKIPNARHTKKRCIKYKKDLTFDNCAGFEKPEFCKIWGHNRIIKICTQCTKCFSDYNNEECCAKERKGIKNPNFEIPEWCPLEKVN